MRQDVRARYDRALEVARRSAYAPGEFAGQESFMRASEIRRLAHRSGVGPRVPVLDLCCGVAGPGRLLAKEFGCDYFGVDASAEAVELASSRAAGLPCRFEVRHVPPLPPGRPEVVLLLETMLAFADKAELLTAVSSSLPVGGRFAFTVEEGLPLTPTERRVMPAAGTVHPIPLPELLVALDRAGLGVRWLDECSRAHRQVARSLLDAFSGHRRPLVGELGERAVTDLLAAHRLWVDWLGSGRVRKFLGVAEKVDRH